jgi:hypothetical protein
MKATSRFVIVAGLGILFAGTAVAQMMGMRGPSMRGVWNPVVGSGAAYSTEQKGGEKSEMQIAIVGKESVDGKDGYWYEMTMQSPRDEGQIVMKSLTVLDGSNVAIKRMIMQMPGQPPMEMPMMMMQQRGNTTRPADIRNDAEDVGSESVTTPAGTFTCEHYRMKDGSADVWVAKNVSPYGLVKSTSKDTTMVLTRVLTEAKDKITGTPVPFSPMGMMQQRQQPN